MAETLRELVVALSLDSSNFSRNMRTINQQIKEAESTFRLAGAGVENFEKTIAGTESKLSMLGNKLTQQNRAVEQYSRALVAANDKLKENYDRHKDYSARLEQAKARQEALRFEVETSKAAYEHYRDTLGETDSATIAAKANLERYQEEHAEATAEVTKLEGQVKALQKTMQNSADAASKAATDLNNAKAAARETDAEIKKLTEELYRMKSAWTQAGKRSQRTSPHPLWLWERQRSKPVWILSPRSRMSGKRSTVQKRISAIWQKLPNGCPLRSLPLRMRSTQSWPQADSWVSQLSTLRNLRGL